jgi:hypothetical protein
VSESGEQTPSGQEPGARSNNLVIVAGGAILIGLVAFAVYRMNNPSAPAAPPASADVEAMAPQAGTPIAAVVPYHLSPEASIVAERYRCVCGCNDPLTVCTCTKTPGSIDMKRHLQGLVDEKKAPHEVDAAMVAKYGELVLLSNPVAKPSPPKKR